MPIGLAAIFYRCRVRLALAKANFSNRLTLPKYLSQVLIAIRQGDVAGPEPPAPAFSNHP